METSIIFIDSKKRNTTEHISPSKYVYELPHEFNNIVSVELVYALYGKAGQDTNHMYVDMYIDELQPQVEGNKTPFTQLPFFKSNDDLYEYNTNQYKSTCKFQRSPLSNLAHLTITFLDRSGRILPMTDHILRFEITTAPIESVDTLSSVKQTLEDKKDPYTLLGIVPGKYDITTLSTAFKNKASLLRREQFSTITYDELKNAFATLVKSIQK
jgi:hypothetical protein